MKLRCKRLSEHACFFSSRFRSKNKDKAIKQASYTSNICQIKNIYKVMRPTLWIRGQALSCVQSTSPLNSGFSSHTFTSISVWMSCCNTKSNILVVIQHCLFYLNKTEDSYGTKTGLLLVEALSWQFWTHSQAEYKRKISTRTAKFQNQLYTSHF